MGLVMTAAPWTSTCWGLIDKGMQMPSEQWGQTSPSRPLSPSRSGEDSAGLIHPQTFAQPYVSRLARQKSTENREPKKMLKASEWEPLKGREKTNYLAKEVEHGVRDLKTLDKTTKDILGSAKAHVATGDKRMLRPTWEEIQSGYKQPSKLDVSNTAWA
eukprot:gene2014-2702_t